MKGIYKCPISLADQMSLGKQVILNKQIGSIRSQEKFIEVNFGLKTSKKQKMGNKKKLFPTVANNIVYMNHMRFNSPEQIRKS